MKTFTKKLSLVTLCALFATMQMSFAIEDTGLGVGNGGAVIKDATGGYAGLETSTNYATLKFTGDAHVYWDTLNVNKGETLNFSAVRNPGMTVLNTVANDMTRVYGSIKADGIGNLIISNPNGLLFDGAHVTSAGDVMLTTQGLDSSYVGGKLQCIGSPNEVVNGVVVSIKDSNFSVGGDFNIIAPNIEVAKSLVDADNFKLVTADGQTFLATAKLVAPTTSSDSNHKAVRLDAVNVNGNVYITSAKGLVNILNGGSIKGDLKINSDGNVAVNYTNNGSTMQIDGNVGIENNGKMAYLRNAKVGRDVNISNKGGYVDITNVDVKGNVGASTDAGYIKAKNVNVGKDFKAYSTNGSAAVQNADIKGNADINNNGKCSFLVDSKVGKNVKMSNAGGFLEVKNVNIKGNADLKTTATNTGSNLKHFIHVVGDNTIGGDLNVDSIHNVHLGGYVDTVGDVEVDDFVITDSSLKVAGTVNALAREGSVGVASDIKADKVNLESGTLNIITDGKANIVANEYSFKANQFIGSLNKESDFIETMEYYELRGADRSGYLNIEGGEVKALETRASNGIANVRANNNMLVTGANSATINLASAKDIKITGPNVHAKQIIVDGETVNLTVDTSSNSRDYTLRYTDIRDNKEITIDKKTEITYDMANGSNGWNKGNQIFGTNTYLVVPGGPVPPPPPPPPGPNPDPTPPDHDNVKLMNFVPIKDIDKAPVATPIAFAADLDDEIDTGVRKNVDGSVTVVRPYAVED